MGQPPAPYDGPGRRQSCKTGDMKASSGAPKGAGAGIKAAPTSVLRPAPAAAPRPVPNKTASPGDRDQMDKLNHQLEVRTHYLY